MKFYLVPMMDKKLEYLRGTIVKYSENWRVVRMNFYLVPMMDKKLEYLRG